MARMLELLDLLDTPDILRLVCVPGTASGLLMAIRLSMTCRALCHMVRNIGSYPCGGLIPLGYLRPEEYPAFKTAGRKQPWYEYDEMVEEAVRQDLEDKIFTLPGFWERNIQHYHTQGTVEYDVRMHRMDYNHPITGGHDGRIGRALLACVENPGHPWFFENVLCVYYKSFTKNPTYFWPMYQMEFALARGDMVLFRKGLEECVVSDWHCRPGNPRTEILLQTVALGAVLYDLGPNRAPAFLVEYLHEVASVFPPGPKGFRQMRLITHRAWLGKQEEPPQFVLNGTYRFHRNNLLLHAFGGVLHLLRYFRDHPDIPQWLRRCGEMMWDFCESHQMFDALDRTWDNTMYVSNCVIVCEGKGSRRRK